MMGSFFPKSPTHHFCLVSYKHFSPLPQTRTIRPRPKGLLGFQYGGSRHIEIRHEVESGWVSLEPSRTQDPLLPKHTELETWLAEVSDFAFEVFLFTYIFEKNLCWRRWEWNVKGKLMFFSEGFGDCNAQMSLHVPGMNGLHVLHWGKLKLRK